MSKVRRDEHRELDFREQFTKQLDRSDRSDRGYNHKPRWRQSAKARYEYVIRELKNEQNG